MGVHSPEEVSQFGCTDLKVLSDTLADKPFFFGDEPTTVSIVSHDNASPIAIQVVSHFVRSVIYIYCFLCK